ncbi:ABC transporter ATP-binding protein [Candidatus Weimeria sp. HCP3S3_B5]|jgi:ABC-2 type transport system ATP-binding protein|uniref:ABC transporter ATP-binding protein n=1 Tax=Candidatus Weimeria sp. HCP3S3_B5 TaxID=3438871 RepID=UPI003F8A449E
MSIVQFHDYSKIIKGRVILENINTNFDSGGIYCVIGENGSGKTMMLRAICGLIHPTTGSVTVEGCEINKNNNFPESVGVVIENPGFFNEYTGFENLKLLASIKGQIRDDDIVDALDRVGLDPSDRRTVKKYSLGMKERLGIAQAIMEKPSLILLDEPTNALDKEGKERLENIIREEKHRGATIIIATHDDAFVKDMAEHRLYIEKGRAGEMDEN